MIGRAVLTAAVICLVFCLLFGVALAQDPLKVAPEAYKLVFENEHVRVQRVHYAPHAKIPEHDHTAYGSAYVYLNDAGPVIFKHVGVSYGAVTRPPVKAGSFRLYKAVKETHEVENTSATPSDFLRVEFKTRPDRNANTLRGKFFREDVAEGENLEKVQFENEQVRITRMVCAAGRRCEVATRAGEPGLFVALTAARFISASATVASLEPGQTRWMGGGEKAQWEGAGGRAAEGLRFEMKTAPLKVAEAESEHAHPPASNPSSNPEARPPSNSEDLEREKARQAEASAQLKRAAALESEGRVEESIAAHLRALEINPELVQAHINLISLYGRRSEAARAEEHYRKAIELNPDLADLHYNYGVLLAGQGRAAEAAQSFERCLALDPYYAEAHHNYAVIIERDGRLDEAAKHYRKAIENKPGHRLAHFHLGRILVNQGKTMEAIEHFQQTLEPEDGETPRFMYALGATYIRAGEKAKGIEYLRGALKRAYEFKQQQLVSSLERDLKRLEGGK